MPQNVRSRCQWLIYLFIFFPPCYREQSGKIICHERVKGHVKQVRHSSPLCREKFQLLTFSNIYWMFRETSGCVHSSWRAMCETSHFPCGLVQLSIQKMFITRGKKSKVNSGDYGEGENSTLKVKNLLKSIILLHFLYLLVSAKINGRHYFQSIVCVCVCVWRSSSYIIFYNNGHNQLFKMSQHPFIITFKWFSFLFLQR